MRADAPADTSIAMRFAGAPTPRQVSRERSEAAAGVNSSPCVRYGFYSNIHEIYSSKNIYCPPCILIISILIVDADVRYLFKTLPYDVSDLYCFAAKGID